MLEVSGRGWVAVMVEEWDRLELGEGMVKITRVTLWGNGVDFNGGAANVVLRTRSGAAPASAWSASLLADGRFGRGFGAWKKFQSNEVDEASIDVHKGREYVERQGLGRAEVTAIHRSADAALLKLPSTDSPSELSPLQVADLPGPGAEVAVAGVLETVRFEHASDLRTWAGAVLEEPAPTKSVTALSAPTHLNNAGGAVLDLEGRLVGIASFVLPGGAYGAATPLARFGELRAGPEHAMPRAEAAGHLAARDGPPPHLPLSPGGPRGKRVSFGEGVFAIKESRAIIASGAFVLDRHDTLEYLACPFKNGKLHETVIALDADPATINLALMALRYESGGGIERLGDPSIPLGDRVLIYVEWDWNEELAIREFLRNVDPPWKRPNHVGVREKVREGAIKWKPGPKVRLRAEDVIFDRINGRPMERTEWVFNGSSFRKDRETGRYYFTATMDGVLAAVYRDPAAVFNTPLAEGRDDIYYCVRDTVAPPRGTRCDLLILPAAPEEANQ